MPADVFATRDAAAPMRLSLVIPVYNEAGHLRDVLDRLDHVAWPCPVEYIIVDDCSRDGSWDIAEAFQREQQGAARGVIAVQQPHNQGKGAALRRGFELATGDIIAVQDADFEYAPEDLVELVNAILLNRADIVYGSRYRKNSPNVHRTFHYAVNRLLTLASNLFSGLYLSDMETCYKVFRAEILKNITIECNRFGFEPEITAKIARLKVRVHEYPVQYFPRNYLEGKKISWKDGVAAVWFILKFNLRGQQDPSIRQVPARYRTTKVQRL
jgi:glycosyltransferase involved in cell wall biosynthesis